MLPSRCPHCQAELPKLGRFCVMCGRRVEGWRGLMPAGDPDLGAAGLHGAAEADFEEPATPREIAGHEERTRPVRPSLNLAAAAATALPDDEESRRPTGEVPSVGHELRAKAPDQRVHTSPIGNILPSDVLETLDEAVAANSARSGPPGDSARSGSARLSGAGSSPNRSGSGPHQHRSGSGSGSGSAQRGPGRPERLDRTPSAPHRQSGKRERPDDRGTKEARGDRSGRRQSAKLRRPQRGELPALAISPAELATDESSQSKDQSEDRATPRRAAPNAPMAIGAEPTHFIPRRKPSSRLLPALRTLMWGLLWLGLGGVVAFSVVILHRRRQPVPPPAQSHRAGGSDGAVPPDARAAE